MIPKRVFYAASGPADFIAAHLSFASGIEHPSEMSSTFSGQIERFCAEVGAKAYFVSTRNPASLHRDGDITIEHHPKRGAAGLLFHLNEVRYGLSLVWRAWKWKADLAILDSGSTHFFVMSAFRLVGIPVLPVLHTTLWPRGRSPRAGALASVIGTLDKLFFRYCPSGVIGVSPECLRQVAAIAPGHRYSLFDIRAQYRRAYFDRIPRPPTSREPFNVLFVGRVDPAKGVLDIPVMAEWIERRRPGSVRWTICGAGPADAALLAEIEARGLGDIVRPRGWTSPEQLQTIYGDMHVTIVPTRSAMNEGMAMTAAEAVLAGRPVVSNPVVPAVEVLGEAAVVAVTDDPISHAAAILALLDSAEDYDRRRAACADAGRDFLDPRFGLTRALHQAVALIRR